MELFKKKQKEYVDFIKPNNNKLYIKWNDITNMINQTNRKRFEMFRTKNPMRVLSKRVISNIQDAWFNGVQLVKNGRFYETIY